MFAGLIFLVWVYWDGEGEGLLSVFLGGINWVEWVSLGYWMLWFAGSSSLGRVCSVRFSGPGFLGKVCWI